MKHTTAAQRRSFIVALVSLTAVLGPRWARAKPLAPHQAIRLLCARVFTTPEARRQ